MASKSKSNITIPPDVIQKYKELRGDKSAIYDKLVTLTSDINEHKTVLNALNQSEDDRRCFHLFNGILFESTAKDVRIKLENNLNGLESMNDTYKTKLKDKETEYSQFCEQNNLVASKI